MVDWNTADVHKSPFEGSAVQFSSAFETAPGDGDGTVDDKVFIIRNSMTEALEYYSSDQVTSTRGKSDIADILASKTPGGEVEFEPSYENLTKFVLWAFGLDALSVGVATPSTSGILSRAKTLEVGLPGAGSGKAGYKYDGVFLDSLTLSGGAAADNSAVKAVAKMIAMSSAQLTSLTSVGDPATYEFLLVKDMTLTIAGTTLVTNEFLFSDFELSISNNLQAMRRNRLDPTAIRPQGDFEVGGRFTLNWNDRTADDVYALFVASTPFIVEVILNNANGDEIKINMPLCIAKDSQLPELSRNADLQYPLNFEARNSDQSTEDCITIEFTDAI